MANRSLRSNGLVQHNEVASRVSTRNLRLPFELYLAPVGANELDAEALAAMHVYRTVVEPEILLRAGR